MVHNIRNNFDRDLGLDVSFGGGHVVVVSFRGLDGHNDPEAGEADNDDEYPFLLRTLAPDALD